MTAEIIAYVAVSLDGYLAADDGSVSFLDEFGSDEFGFTEFLDSVGCLAMGSTTYEQVLGFGWPYGDRPCLVMTTRDLATPEGADITFRDEPIGQAIGDFSTRTDGRLWVVGGGRVITAAIAAGVLDTLELYVMPVALGSGIPLFTAAPEQPLALRETTPFENGVVRLVYSLGA